MEDLIRRRNARILPTAVVLLAAGILLGRAASSPVPSLLMLIPLVPLFCCRSMRRMAALFLTLALGFYLGWSGYHPALPPEGDAVVSGIICDEIVTGSRDNRRSRLTGVTLNGSPVSGDAYWTFFPADGETLPAALTPGMRVTFIGSVYEPAGSQNPGDFDFRDYLLGQGITFGVYGRTDWHFSRPDRFSLRGTFAALRHHLTDGLLRMMGEDAGGYAAAMLLGTRALIVHSDRDAFSKLGIAHLLSVSGFHVGVLVFLLHFILRNRSRLLQFCIELPVLTAYILLTGSGAPVVRAAVLSLLAAYGILRKQQVSPFHILCASFILMLIVRPAQLTSAGFQLTFAALIGLIFVPRALPQRSGRVYSTFSAAVAAQTGVLLPQLYWFHELPLLGIILSPIVLLMGTVLIISYWVVLVMLPIPGLNTLAGTCAAWLTGLLTTGVRAMSQLGIMTLWTKQANLLTAIGWTLLIIGCAMFRKKKVRPLLPAAILLIVISLVPLPHRGTQYIQFAVGNEDASILYDDDVVTVIDTGSDGDTVMTWLHQRRLGIDTLVLTHLHDDHAGGLDALLENRIPIGQILIPEGAELAQINKNMHTRLNEARTAGIPVAEIAAGYTLSLPHGTLTAVWPEHGRIRLNQDANIYPLVLLCELRGTRMLLTSDLDGRLERYAARPADILRMAHHGSAGSTAEDFTTAVSPAAVLISSKATDRLQSIRARFSGIPVFSTGSGGALTVYFEDGGAYTITTYLPEEAQ